MPALVLILLLLLGLAGCQAGVTAETSVRDDGSGSSSLRLEIGPELARLLEEGGGGEDIFAPLEAGLQGWQIESGVESEGGRWFHATRGFASLEELRGREEEPPEGGGEAGGGGGADAGAAGGLRLGVPPLLDQVEVWTTSDPFTERFHFEAQTDLARAVAEIAAGTPELAEVQRLREVLKVEQRLRLPGSVREHNADEVVAGELVWRPGLEGSTTLRAVSERYRWEWLAPLVALAILGVLATAAVAYQVLVVRRRRGFGAGQGRA